MDAAARIIVVDDEPDLRLLLEDYLGAQGLAVRTAADGAELEARLREGPADLLILDVNMPGEDGFAVARRLREAGSAVGIIMLTAAGAVENRLTGLDAGADDYLAKPFEPRELLARVRSVLRRLEAGGSEAPSTPPGPRTARFGRCELDLNGRRLLDVQGKPVPLTAMEFDLLATFARHPRQVLARERLSELAHNRPLEPDDRSIDIRITRLRKKIEVDPANPTTIRTVRGEGYLFDPGAAG
jgi:two-component system phosphate regulon response regulator OmpR